MQDIRLKNHKSEELKQIEKSGFMIQDSENPNIEIRNPKCDDSQHFYVKRKYYHGTRRKSR